MRTAKRFPAFAFAAVVGLLAWAASILPPSPGVQASVISQQTVITITGSLSSAQILSLNTVPVTVIPNQGLGSVVQVLGAVFEGVYGGTVYAGTGVLTANYGSGGVQITPNCTAAILTTAANTMCLKALNVGIASGLTSTNYVNQPIVLSESSAMTLGNGTLSYWINYTVLTGF